MNVKKNSIAALAAASVIGAGIVGVNAGQAQAAGTVWDRVATCESGNNWAINTGNGFYGGLQFTQQTWAGYGGTAYAPTANQASRAQQIAVAQKVLASAGPGAWPVCSVRAGLTRANGAGVVSAPAATTVTKTNSTAKVVKPAATAKPAVKAAAKPAPAPAKPAPAATQGQTVKVQAGDCLSTIAARHHVKGGWKALWDLNKSTVKNPNLIFVGQELKVA